MNALEAKLAEARAEALLISHMTPMQRREWADARCFTVLGSDGHRYRIRASTKVFQDRMTRWRDERRYVTYVSFMYEIARTVFDIDRGVHVNAYVDYSRFKFPECDNILTQKLTLELNAPAFTSIACLS